MHVYDHARDISRALSWTQGTHFADSEMPYCDRCCLKAQGVLVILG